MGASYELVTRSRIFAEAGGVGSAGVRGVGSRRGCSGEDDEGGGGHGGGGTLDGCHRDKRSSVDAGRHRGRRVTGSGSSESTVRPCRWARRPRSRLRALDPEFGEGGELARVESVAALLLRPPAPDAARPPQRPRSPRRIRLPPMGRSARGLGYRSKTCVRGDPAWAGTARPPSWPPPPSC